jgi:hypothetical protein
MCGGFKNRRSVIYERTAISCGLAAKYRLFCTYLAHGGRRKMKTRNGELNISNGGDGTTLRARAASNRDIAHDAAHRATCRSAWAGTSSCLLLSAGIAGLAKTVSKKRQRAYASLRTGAHRGWIGNSGRWQNESRIALFRHRSIGRWKISGVEERIGAMDEAGGPAPSRTLRAPLSCRRTARARAPCTAAAAAARVLTLPTTFRLRSLAARDNVNEHNARNRRKK